MTSTVDVVIVGLGYVGLPLAHAATAVGLRVVGVDADGGKVDGIRGGISGVDDISNDHLAAMRDQKFVATTDSSAVGNAATVVLCVLTPLSMEGGPDLTAIRSAAEAVAQHLEPRTLGPLESTTWPGTTTRSFARYSKPVALLTRRLLPRVLAGTNRSRE